MRSNVSFLLKVMTINVLPSTRVVFSRGTSAAAMAVQFGYVSVINNGGLSRYEFEQEIPFEAAQDLLKLCEPGMIDKTRWLVKSGKHIFEVDEFYGDNEGLVMAEVELGTEDEQYEKPDFIGEEVTGDRRFYNSHLRQYPYKMWRQQSNH